MHFLDFARCWGTARADRPHRLVGNRNLAAGEFGRETLANTLRGSGADFVAEYVRATRALPTVPRFFPPEITAAILRLRNQ